MTSDLSEPDPGLDYEDVLDGTEDQLDDLPPITRPPNADPEDSDEDEIEITNLRRLVSDEALEISRLQSLLAASRKRQKELVDQLEFLMEGQDGSSATAKKTKIGPGGWRAVSIRELNLGSVRGLGGNKLEVLCEQCPTIGDLEDLRAGDGIRSIKGFGEAIAERIEEKVLDWLTINRDQAAMEFANQNGDPDPQRPATSDLRRFDPANI